MTTVHFESFKDITDLDRQVCRSELHSWNEPKMTMSKENIEKFKKELKSYDIDIEVREPLTFNTIIGAIPILTKSTGGKNGKEI